MVMVTDAPVLDTPQEIPPPFTPPPFVGSGYSTALPALLHGFGRFTL